MFKLLYPTIMSLGTDSDRLQPQSRKAPTLDLHAKDNKIAIEFLASTARILMLEKNMGMFAASPRC
jgi:hypothetical protein